MKSMIDRFVGCKSNKENAKDLLSLYLLGDSPISQVTEVDGFGNK